MHPDDTTYGEVRHGTLTLSGNGFDVRVDGGTLRVRDGAHGEYKDVRFHRATCGIERVVVTRPDGAISFAATKWLHGIGAAIAQLDWDGTVLLASGPQGSDRPSLRRAQALAPTNGTGLAIMQAVMARKVAGQAAVLREMGHDVEAAWLDGMVRGIESAATLAGLANVESQAAAAYWACWEAVPLAFARRDAKAAPEHRGRFGTRTSPLTGAPRKAATPGNALLNYLYGILEVEARIACLAVGLDPGLGFLHADQPCRDSLALDVMEAARPDVDRWLLGWLREARFSKRDFFEELDGTVRLTRPLSGHLAPTAALWRQAVAPVAELVAAMLAGKRMPTPLTETNRSRGRQGVRRWDGVKRQETDNALRTCRECGRVLERCRRRFCSDQCRTSFNQEVAVPRFVTAGITALAERRALGADPSHGGDAARKRGATNARHVSAAIAWEQEQDGGQDPKIFVVDVLPGLRDVPLSAIVRATGLSLRYCSLIRQGLKVPHARHWEVLQQLCQQP